MTTYIDASVLLRVVLGEPGRLATWGQDAAISSELIRVECLRAVDRARSALHIPEREIAEQRAEVLAALDTFFLARINEAVLLRAADPFPTALGTLDAIHLATALELRGDHPDLRLATHDRELGTAAIAVGFEVEGL
jgi:uncharacterized protein